MPMISLYSPNCSLIKISPYCTRLTHPMFSRVKATTRLPTLGKRSTISMKNVGTLATLTSLVGLFCSHAWFPAIANLIVRVLRKGNPAGATLFSIWHTSASRCVQCKQVPNYWKNLKDGVPETSNAYPAICSVSLFGR